MLTKFSACAVLAVSAAAWNQGYNSGRPSRPSFNAASVRPQFNGFTADRSSFKQFEIEAPEFIESPEFVGRMRQQRPSGPAIRPKRPSSISSSAFGRPSGPSGASFAYGKLDFDGGVGYGAYNNRDYGYGRSGYQRAYSQPSYNQYNQRSYNQPSYDQYNQRSYNQPSYDQYNQYNQRSYNQPSYEQYNQRGYNQPSYNQRSYGQRTYNGNYGQDWFGDYNQGYAAPNYGNVAYGGNQFIGDLDSLNQAYGNDYANQAYTAPSYDSQAYSAPSRYNQAYSAPKQENNSYAAPKQESYSAPTYVESESYVAAPEPVYADDFAADINKDAGLTGEIHDNQVHDSHFTADFGPDAVLDHGESYGQESYGGDALANAFTDSLGAHQDSYAEDHSLDSHTEDNYGQESYGDNFADAFLTGNIGIADEVVAPSVSYFEPEAVNKNSESPQVIGLGADVDFLPEY